MKGKNMCIKEVLMAWADRFDNDHYEFDIHGNWVKVDLPKKIVYRLAEISQILVDRVVEAKGELTTADYVKLEEKMQQECKDGSDWLFQTVLVALQDERLFGRYKDIEKMIAKLKPRGYPEGSAPYLFTVEFEIHRLIYVVIRHVDDIDENYNSLAYSFFLGILSKCWGEGLGWSKDEDGNWTWRRDERD